MGWREVLGAEALGKERKYRKDDAPQSSYLSGLSDLSGGLKGGVRPEARPTAKVVARRDRVLAILAEQPEIQRAAIADDSDPDSIVVAIAVRGIGTCELAIARTKWDPIQFLELLSHHSAVLQ